MVTPTPETSWRLLVMDPDVTKALAVVALCKVGLDSVFQPL